MAVDLLCWNPYSKDRSQVHIRYISLLCLYKFLYVFEVHNSWYKYIRAMDHRHCYSLLCLNMSQLQSG